MKLAVPVNSSSEVIGLHRAGADEFYCGYFDSEWQASYGRYDSISRRQGEANYSSWDDLKATVSEASVVGVPVYLAVNSRYTSEQYDEIFRLIDNWRSIGGSGIIVKDMGLLSRLKALNYPGLKITASLLFPVFNKYAADMLNGYGVSRVVLPRCLSIGEMKAICSETDGMEFEAMIMGDKCRMIDGFCRSIHAESSLSAGFDSRFPNIDFSKGCVHLCMQYGSVPEDPCAVCEIPELEDAGITIGKIGGRGLPLDKRIRWLSFIKRSAGLTNDEKKKLYTETFSHSCSCYYTKKPFLCDNPSKADGSDTYLFDNLIGHHSCVGALSEIKQYLLDNDTANDKNVFVIPPVTPDHFKTFEDIIELISEKGDDNTEIVINDYGALAYCKMMADRGELHVRLTAGLLLSGQDTDPFFASLNNTDDKMLRHLSEPSVLSGADIAAEYSITGVELCRQPVENDELLSALEGLDVRLYDISVLSVKPCCGDCDNCREKTVVRNGKEIISNRNLLFYYPD